MCILFVRRFAPEEYFLKYVIAFNRDERVDRPTEHLHEWRVGGKRVASGRDLEHGGTWLIVGEDGTFAAVTNIREEPVPHDIHVSRGALLTKFLASGQVDWFRADLDAEAPLVANANIVYGNLKSGRLHHCQIHAREAMHGPVDDTFVISNGCISSQWPKVRHGTVLFEAALGNSSDQAELVENLWGLLQDRQKQEHNAATVLTVEEEAAVSSIFVDPIPIKTPHFHATFATVSSSIVLVSHDSKVTFLERNWHPPIEAIKVEL